MEVSQSKLTIALNKANYFASAFHGFIAFGTLCFNGVYNASEVFIISTYNLKQFSENLCQFFFFVSSNGESNGQGVIFTVLTDTYFWQAHVCIDDQRQKKYFLTLGIERNSEIFFKVDFNLEELNNLIHSVLICTPFTICFTENEFQFFYHFLNLSVPDFLSLATKKDISNQVKICFSSENHAISDSVLEKLIVMFSFYKEIFISIRCFKDLMTED